MIGNRQAATPRGRRHRTFQRLQQRLGVAVGDRQGRDLEDRRGVLTRQSPGVLGRAVSGGCRIAGEGGHVGHRAALETAGRSGGPLWIDLVGGITVVARVGIDDRAHRTVFLRQFRLEPTPAGAVAGDDHLALHRDTQALQGVVVGGHAVVHIDQRGRDIAVALEGHIGGQLVGRAGRGFVAGDRSFGKRGLERGARAADQFQRHLFRRRIEDLEHLHLRVPAPGFELGQGHFGVGLVVG